MKETFRLYSENYLKIYLLSLAMFLGAAQTWVTRHSVNSDAVSYLDIGDAYFRGDWHNAINGMWSPLYSLILGAAIYLFKPSLDWEYPLAHIVNFALYLATLFSFNFYLQEVLRERRRRLTEGDPETLNTPEWLFLLVAYLIFIWATLVLIKIKQITPDFCVAAIVFIVAGLMLRIKERGGSSSYLLWALLGIILGIGYLAKAPLLPLGFVFILCAAILNRKSPQVWSRVMVAIICLLCVATPFIAALSIVKNKITFSENGKINYEWHVNGVKRFHWQGGDEREGTPVHPTRKILDAPAVYEFGTPIPATYPVWYDPSYWYEGLAFQFKPLRQLRKFVGQIFIHYLPMFSFYGTFLGLGFVVLFYLSLSKRELLLGVWAHWFLLVPALAAMVMYALIHVETRYVAPFVAIILISFVSGINSLKIKNRHLAIIVLTAALGLSILPAAWEMSSENVQNLIAGVDTGDNHWLIAAQSKQAGMDVGDKIASLGRGNDDAAKWARLAKVKIVAEIYDPADIKLFWESDSAVKQNVANAFAASGAKFMVAANAPPSALAEGWQQLSGTNVFVYRLSAQLPLEK